MQGAIVLMYHRIGEGALPGRETGEELYAVSRETFTRQLEVVAGCAHPVAPLSSLIGLSAEAGAVADSVIFTFDDGNRSDLEIAAELLLRHRFPATFFITPAFVGLPGYLTWEQVRELDNKGMEIGAHGLDHTLLSTLPEDELRRHLRESRRQMAEKLGKPPRCMSLPGGAGDSRELRLAFEEGFELVAGSKPTIARSLSRDQPIPRFALRATDPAQRFEPLVTGARAEHFRQLARYRVASALRNGLLRRSLLRFRRAWSR